MLLKYLITLIIILPIPITEKQIKLVSPASFNPKKANIIKLTKEPNISKKLIILFKK